MPTQKLIVWVILFGSALAVQRAGAVQFSYLDPGYSQQIYTTPLTPNQEAGMAWTSSGHLLTRAGSTIIEYNLTPNTTHQGTSVHGVLATHSISGLSGTGYGITNGKDGFIYAITNTGLQRFAANFSGSAQNLTSTFSQGYGITTLPTGKIAYVGGSGTNEVYVYDPVALTNTLVYTSSYSIDDIEANGTGQIALAEQMNKTITVINSTGSWINTFSTLTHNPDGLAFGDGAASNALFSNNNDGTISMYVLGAGYLGTPVITDIAAQLTASGKAYGDLAAVGPDCAFYVFQGNNNGMNGSTTGVGTHWDNGITNAEASIVRISALDPAGIETCGFYSSTEAVPEPMTFIAVGLGLAGVIARKRSKA